MEPRALTFGRSVMTWQEPCDAQAWAARESTSSFVTAKSPSRRSSTSTFTSSLATQETAGPSRLRRRNARGHSSTATRKRSKTLSHRRTDWSRPHAAERAHRDYAASWPLNGRGVHVERFVQVPRSYFAILTRPAPCSARRARL